MKMDCKLQKLSLEEYQQYGEKSGYAKSAKSLLILVTVAVGIAVAYYLISIVMKLFDLHEIVGYVGIVLSAFVFIFFYIIPINKIYATKSFVTSVTNINARQAQKHNKRLREDLADKIIDSVSRVEGLNWYSDEHIKNLAIARHTKNDKVLNDVLSEMYSSDIKRAANHLIRKCAVQVGVSTAISQSDVIDALLIVIFELKLTKDIVYLYGYRPSDSEMVKILKSVLRNSLIAYGISIAAEGVAQIVGSAMGSFPIIGVVVQSGIQGIVNSTFAVVLGKQTIKYLVNEYHLQDMLDNVELIDSDENDEKLLIAIADEVKKSTSKSKANKKSPTPTAA